MFRVIIAGSRDFTDYSLLETKLNALFSKKTPSSIVCGMCRGADLLGKQYADTHGIAVDKFPANWNKYGKSAGYKRNVQMADNADALVAFWDGVSRGTKHMIDIAKSKGLEVKIVRTDLGV